MTTSYRYLFADILSNAIIAELPLTGVSFTQQLNQAGTLTGHILLSGIDADTYNAINGTTPAKTAIYVDRNGVLVWGGVIWGRPYNSDSQQLTIQAREFESYFERRKITTTQAFTAQDQLLVARTLITQAQSEPSGNIGVQVGTEVSGVAVTRTYYGYEYKQVYGAIQDLARQLNGFDFLIKVSYDVNDNPQKVLQLGYPRLGVAYTANSPSIPVFELPASNMVSYSLSEDASVTANTIYALGAGSNEGKLIRTAQDTSKFVDGYPLLEEQVNYSEITDSTYLAQLATGQVLSVSNPVTIFKITVPAYVAPEFGTYNIGDNVRLRITDARFETTLDAIYRIVAISVEPGENGPERVVLTLTQTTN
jgi:hypothetical protein